MHGDGLTSLQFRRTAGAVTEQIESTLKAPDVIQLERRGGTYIMSVARFGEPFVAPSTVDVDLGDEVYVGLFVCSHNPTVAETAQFQQRPHRRAAEGRLARRIATTSAATWRS